jgi:hypothetical protein
MVDPDSIDDILDDGPDVDDLRAAITHSDDEQD